MQINDRQAGLTIFASKYPSMFRVGKIRILLLSFCLLMTGALFSVSAQAPTDTVVHESVPERTIEYNRNLLNPGFDFELKPTAPGKFRVMFDNNTEKAVVIKIYDIIGNLLINYEVSQQGEFIKEFDVSAFHTRLFVVEIGNSKYNKAKSVISG